MAREIERLTALQVQRAIRRGKPVKLCDGGGLWLHVTPDGAYWFFRYSDKAMSLGPVHTVGLGDARAKAAACRKLLIDGLDPKAARDQLRASVAAAAAKQISFAEATDAYCDAHRAGWRTAKHGKEVRETLRAYAEPVFGTLAIAAIDTTFVLKVLQPIWVTRPDAATRLRQRMEVVLDYAAGARLARRAPIRRALEGASRSLAACGAAASWRSSRMRPCPGRSCRTSCVGCARSRRRKRAALSF